MPELLLLGLWRDSVFPSNCFQKRCGLAFIIAQRIASLVFFFSNEQNFRSGSTEILMFKTMNSFDHNTNIDLTLLNSVKEEKIAV